MTRRVSRPLTVQRAVELRLLLQEPLTKPLGSIGADESFSEDDVVTLVQWSMAGSTDGCPAHATLSQCRLRPAPLIAAENAAPLGLFAPEIETPTAMERLRDKAHARLVSLEAAADGGARAGRAHLPADDLGARSGAALRARQSAPGVSSDDARGFRDARLALRRAYAEHKLSSSSSKAAADSQQLEALVRAWHVGRRRARSAWLWAVGMGACAMLLAYALTLQLLSLREAALVSARTTRPREQDACLMSAPVDAVHVVDAASSPPVSTTQPLIVRRRAEHKASGRSR